MKKLMRLVEEKTAFIQTAKGTKKVIDYTSDQELTSMKNNQDIKSIETADGKKLKEEAGRKYTAEESQAVGKTVGKSLLKVLRGQGDEVVDIRLTGVGLNKFGIKVKYGNDKGQDLFKFTLDPNAESITLHLGTEPVELVDFIITQGNTVSLPAPDLEDKLADIMKKYVSEPAPTNMEDSIMEVDFNDPIAMKLRAAKMEKPQPAPIKQKPAIDNSAKIKALEKERERIMFDMEQEAEPEGGPIADRYGVMLNRIDNAINKLRGSNQEKDVDISQAEIERRARMIKENTSEVTKHVGDKYINYPEKGGKRLGTFSTKSAAEKQLKAIEINKHKNEALDPVGKEDDDINNDGKVNSTDKYLTKRRQAIAKNIKEDLDLGHEDDEPGMLLGDIYGIMQSAKSLYQLVSQFKGEQEVDFPHWWQAKIVNAKANLSAARQYLDYEVNKPQQVNISAVALQEVDVTAGTKSTTTTPSDVKALAKVQQSATAVQTRAKNINNITEFPGAFEEWVKTLGLVPGKISRGSIEAQVRKSLTKLGYK